MRACCMSLRNIVSMTFTLTLGSITDIHTNILLLTAICLLKVLWGAGGGVGMVIKGITPNNYLIDKISL